MSRERGGRGAQGSRVLSPAGAGALAHGCRSVVRRTRTHTHIHLCMYSASEGGLVGFRKESSPLVISQRAWDALGNAPASFQQCPQQGRDLPAARGLWLKCSVEFRAPHRKYGQAFAALFVITAKHSWELKPLSMTVFLCLRGVVKTGS